MGAEAGGPVLGRNLPRRRFRLSAGTDDQFAREKLVEQAFPDQASKSDVVLVVARPHGKLRHEDYEVADRLAGQVPQALAHLADQMVPKKTSPVTTVLSYDEPVIGRKLISPAGGNGQAVLVVLELDTEFMAVDNIPDMQEIFRTVDSAAKGRGFSRGARTGRDRLGRRRQRHALVRRGEHHQHGVGHDRRWWC